MQFDDAKHTEFVSNVSDLTFSQLTQRLQEEPLLVSTNLPVRDDASVISKESQKNRQFISTANSKSPKNEGKQKTTQKGLLHERKSCVTSHVIL
jgi:hypothetical protein